MVCAVAAGELIGHGDTEARRKREGGKEARRQGQRSRGCDVRRSVGRGENLCRPYGALSFILLRTQPLRAGLPSAAPTALAWLEWFGGDCQTAQRNPPLKAKGGAPIGVGLA